MNAVQSVLHFVWQQGWQASVAAGVVLLARFLLRGWIGPRWGYTLWLIVLAKLVLPVFPASVVSVFNLMSAHVNSVENPALARDEVERTSTTETRGFPLLQINSPPAPQGGGRRTARISSEDFVSGGVFFVWILGTISVLWWMLNSQRKFARRVAEDPHLFPPPEYQGRREDGGWPIDPSLRKLLDDCRKEVGIRPDVELYVTSAVESPALVGLARPRILLPPGLTDELSARQMRLVFLHELSHLRCGDLWIDWLWSILLCIHWFNPMLWVSFALFRSDREQARDAMVMRRTRQAEDYGQTLIRVIQSVSRPFPRPGVLAMAGGAGTLRRRMAMVAGFDAKPKRGRGVVVLVLALICLTRARAQQASTQPAVPFPILSTAPSAEAGDELPQKTVPSVNFDHDPLAMDINYLYELFGVNVAMEYRVIGVDPATPITLHLSNAKLSDVLDAIIAQIGPGKFHYGVDRDVVAISTSDGLQDIRDMEAEEDYSNAPGPYGKMLERRLPVVALHSGVTLADAIKFLQDVTGLKFDVQWDALASAGVEKKDPVNFESQNAKTGKVLDMILRDAGEGKIGFNVDLNEVTISTRAALDKMQTIRAYDVQDVIDYWKIEAGNTQGPQDQIEALVRKQVAWDAGDSLDWNPGELVVTQTRENQRKIAELVGTLRESLLPMVTISARILMPNDTPEAKEPLEKVLAKSDPGVLSDAQMNSTLIALLRDKQTSVIHAPRITMRLGQSAILQAATPTMFKAMIRDRRGALVGIERKAMDGAEWSAKIDQVDAHGVKFDFTFRMSKLTRIESVNPANDSAGQQAIGSHVDLTRTVTLSGDQWVVLRCEEDDGVGIQTGNEPNLDWTIPKDFPPTTEPAQPHVVYLTIQTKVLPPSK